MSSSAPGGIAWIRPWREGDLQTMHSLRNDLPLQRQLMARAQPATRDEVRAWLAQKASAADTMFFVIASTEDDTAVGYVQAAAVDARNGTAELGVCVSPAARGRGIGFAACRLLEGALREAGLRKLTLRVLASNVGAIDLYCRLGYRLVGRLERHHLHGDHYEDVVLMERFIDG